MSAIVVVILIIAILLVIFTLQNSSEITIQLFFWEIVNAPLVLVLLGCIVIGYILAAFYFYPRLWNLKNENKRISKQIKEFQKKAGLGEGSSSPDDDHPEGMSMDDNENRSSFFKD
jgi:uncharacterized integral membrane protein